MPRYVANRLDTWYRQYSVLDYTRRPSSVASWCFEVCPESEHNSADVVLGTAEMQQSTIYVHEKLNSRLEPE